MLEREVKKQLKKMLKDFSETESPIYVHWPVLCGMGKPELDCNVIVKGYALSIECKAPGEKLTMRQHEIMRMKIAAGGLVLACDGSDESMGAIANVLFSLSTGAYFDAFVRAQNHCSKNKSLYGYNDG